MTAFETAWNILKNAPVPDYAQPKIRYDGSKPDESTGLPFTQPPPRSAMEDEGEKERHREKYLQGREDNRYGLAERMPRPEVGTGESSFDSERMNTGTSVFNPAPSWQNMGDSADMQNTMSSSPVNVKRPPSADMGATGVQQQQQPNDGTGRYPQQQTGRYPQFY